MACYPIIKEGSVVGHLCGDLGDHCSECGFVAENLCDYPVGDGKTCDRLLCDECSKQVGIDLHYCTTHKKHWDKFRRNGGVDVELSNVTPFEGR